MTVHDPPDPATPSSSPPAPVVRWSEFGWRFAADRLPPPPARVLDLGCGPWGGLVPTLLEAGYDAVGVDPVAPEPSGPDAPYHQVEFESFAVERPVDAIFASRSLHHVAEIDVVADQMAKALRFGGVVVVLEWDWEHFDEATARWCFDRLPPPEPDPEPDHRPSWLRSHRERWIESGLPWEAYFRSWVDEHGFHRADAIIEALDGRFHRTALIRGPFAFCDLAHTTAADEQAAIDAGDIQANGFRYAAIAAPSEIV